jgi:hypothetical protein
MAGEAMTTSAAVSAIRRCPDVLDEENVHMLRPPIAPASANLAAVLQILAVSGFIESRPASTGATNTTGATTISQPRELAATQ